MDEKLLMYSTFQYRIIISNVRYPTSVRTLDDRIWYYTTKVAVSLSAILILELDIIKFKGLVQDSCGNDPHNRHLKGMYDMTGPFRRSPEFFFFSSGRSRRITAMRNICRRFGRSCKNVYILCI